MQLDTLTDRKWTGEPYMGSPPNDSRSHMRCQRILWKNGERCGHWAMRGSRWCTKHGGRREAARKKSPRLYRIAKMPRAYSKYLTRTLSEALEEQTGVNPQEQLQLYDELALIRDSAGQAVKLYGAARQASEEDPTSLKKQEFVFQAGAIMREQLKEVISACEAAARLENSAKDKISIHQLHFFIQQIVRAAYNVLGDDVETVRKIEHSIKTTIRLPSSGIEGTVVTPDMDVNAMDESVPRG